MKEIKKIYIVISIVVALVLIAVASLIYLRYTTKKSIDKVNEAARVYETDSSKETEETVATIEIEATTEQTIEESKMFTENLSSYVGYIVISPFVASEEDLDSIIAVAYEDYSVSKALYLWRTGFNQEDGYFINISSYDNATGEFVSYTKPYYGDELLGVDISEILYYEEHENSITVYK